MDKEGRGPQNPKIMWPSHMEAPWLHGLHRDAGCKAKRTCISRLLGFGYWIVIGYLEEGTWCALELGIQGNQENTETQETRGYTYYHL